jgi:oligoendopeptidase F
MNLKWNLRELYKNNEEFYNEINYVKKLLYEVMNSNVDINDANDLLFLLNSEWHIKELANNILVYGSLMYYKNIKSEECIKLKDDAEKFSNEVNSKLKFIENKILTCGKNKIFRLLEENTDLQIYKQHINNLFRLQEHIQKEEINNVIRDNNNKISEYINKYNKLLRDIDYGQIEVNDETIEINSSNFAKYISSRDRETRKKTYLSVDNCFNVKNDEFADLLNNIYGYRIENSELENYDTVLDKVLSNENINPNILKSLIQSVNNNLPLIQKYLSLKAEILKIDDPHLYDFGVPLDNNLKLKYSMEEAVEIIKNALSPLGEEYLENVEYLLNGHFDAEPDDHKHQSITFSWNTYSFMNFRGSYNDLKNMIHELGHIINYSLSKKNLPFIYEDSTIFVGETASIVNEILLNRYLYKNAKNTKEKLFYLSKEIENYFTSVFKQTMYTEYENELYSFRKENDLTKKILSEKYFKLIKKYYGENITYDEEASYEWSRLGHLYRWSYYPYKYATGLIMASVVVNSLIDEKTLSKEQYMEFLASGSCMYSLDLLKMLNIDLTNSDIINEGFNILKKDVEELEKNLILKK